MAKVICLQCSSESHFSLIQPTYQGPYRCTQCKATFNIKIENDEVKFYRLLDQQEIDKLKLHNPYK